LPVMITIIPPGKMKREKWNLERHERFGRNESGTFREIGQQEWTDFIAVH
jgi:hypothetical protein